ncbi:MAG: glycosyltransferase, partial [Candidatus Poribacteria bacterium]
GAEQRPTAEIRRVSQSIYDEFLAPPGVKHWMRSRTAICFYGHSQPARNVQIRGLHDASRSWGIPFEWVTVGAEQDLTKLLGYERILFITTLAFVPLVSSILSRRDGAIALMGNWYETPDSPWVPQLTAQDVATLDEYREQIAVVLSECSREGTEKYCRGYIDKHGLPVMSFTWGINLFRHFPVTVLQIADLVFLGSYFEKTSRIDAYFGEPLRRFSHTFFGVGWEDSPHPISDRMLDDFDAAAPILYSGHAISLNVHQPYEEEGFTCNERTFNSVAWGGGGVQITDRAPRVRDFFGEDEVIVAEDASDFLDKVEHFVVRPEERTPYVEKARRRVVAEHTYHHRLCDLLWYVIEGRTRYSHCPVLER